MEKTSINSIPLDIKGKTLLICSSSFENRCLSIPTALKGNVDSDVIICYFPNNYKSTDNNLLRIKELFPFDRVSTVELSLDSPLNNYDILLDILTKSHYDNILFDISTFTREILLVIIKILSSERLRETCIKLLYCPSSRYSSFEEGDGTLPWLSKGIRNIRSVVGYAGDMSPIKKTLLIVLVGFEFERAQLLIESFEPNALYLGVASPDNSHNESLGRINEKNFNKLLERNSLANRFNFSCKDISQNIPQLSHIIDNNKENYNIVISPMNNKLSTLSVAAVAMRYPEVQICYAPANQYNIESYSTPENEIYILSLEEIIA